MTIWFCFVVHLSKPGSSVCEYCVGNIRQSLLRSSMCAPLKTMILSSWTYQQKVVLSWWGRASSATSHFSIHVYLLTGRFLTQMSIAALSSWLQSCLALRKFFFSCSFLSHSYPPPLLQSFQKLREDSINVFLSSDSSTTYSVYSQESCIHYCSLWREASLRRAFVCGNTYLAGSWTVCKCS